MKIKDRNPDNDDKDTLGGYTDKMVVETAASVRTTR